MVSIVREKRGEDITGAMNFDCPRHASSSTALSLISGEIAAKCLFINVFFIKKLSVEKVFFYQVSKDKR